MKFDRVEEMEIENVRMNTNVAQKENTLDTLAKVSAVASPKTKEKEKKENSVYPPSGADLSALYKHSAGLVQWSPNGKYLAVAKNNRLSIRDGTTMELVQVQSCLDYIHMIEWSPDAQYVMTAMNQRSTVQVWSIDDSSWSCKITEGLAGLVGAKWTPDSRHLITVSDFNIHLSIWSLLDRSSFVVRNPKLGIEGITFAPDGSYFAVAERIECKDYIGIYSCESWELVRHFPLDTFDVSAIEWSPDNRVLSVRETSIQYKVLFYLPEGKKLSAYEAYQDALGIKSSAWSQSGQFFAVGSYDENVRIINNMTWEPIATLNHTSTDTDTNAIGYREMSADANVKPREKNRDSSLKIGTQSASSSSSSRAVLLGNSKLQYLASDDDDGGSGSGMKSDIPQTITFKTASLPIEMPSLPLDATVANPRLGVGIVAWSQDDQYLLSRNDNMPHTVWVWKTDLMTLHSVIVFLAPVKSVRWDPLGTRFALCTGNNRVYFWTPEGTSWIDVPADNFKILGLRWKPDGNSIVLLGKEEMCCVYL